MAGEKNLKRIGRVLYVYMRGFIDNWISEEVDKTIRTGAVSAGIPLDPDDAALLSGNGKDSPSLVRLRTVTARLRELELDQKRGDVIPRKDIHTGFAAVANVLRRASEQIERHYGHDAKQILDDALDDAVREIETQFGKHDTSRDNGSAGKPDDQRVPLADRAEPDAPPADNARVRRKRDRHP